MNQTAPENTSTPQEQAVEVGPDQRDNTRYLCHGSVEFIADGTEVRTFAKLVDVSFGGCYVEMTATSVPGTVVYLAVSAENIRFCVNGVVRTSFPCLGMGITFTQMSAPDQAYLQQLLLSLSAQSKPMPDPIPLPAKFDGEAIVKALAELFAHTSTVNRDEFLRILSTIAE